MSDGLCLLLTQLRIDPAGVLLGATLAAVVGGDINITDTSTAWAAALWTNRSVGESWRVESRVTTRRTEGALLLLVLAWAAVRTAARAAAWAFGRIFGWTFGWTVAWTVAWAD